MVIYKYPVLMGGIKIEACIKRWLTVKLQNGKPMAWAELDANLPTTKWKIHCIGTGWETNMILGEYLGTIVTEDGLVWHYYVEKIEEDS